ncbi:threonine--tRNA ligase [Candidatus Peregrinibacteria bacterium HGW-Peregrinibacteria-1]|jgi:threonyl-tRNA synthetase|nr:MAG: threonine--tRNA ligase [Candidatus Peregrinibacteria bacterium HGW-Peregrinibacteria-1]
MSKVSEKMDIEAVRHSCAHVLAQAVMDMFPEAKLGIGPTIENGFYYDFELPRTLIPEDLPILEKKMKQIVKQSQKFVGEEVKGEDAIHFLKEADQPYKVQLAEEFTKEGQTLTFYKNVMPRDEKTMFVDLCRGGHTEHTGQIGAFKLLKIAGAYWKGDEKNPMLQRIYGTAWHTREEMDEYLKQLAEAEKRDHRKLGKQLELFAFDEEVGPGLPLWLPKGSVMVEMLEDLAKRKESEYGYERVRSPHIAKEDLYLRSGHLPYYEDSMYPPMEMDNTKYYLKAMNCPHHHKIYGAIKKSYRDLPVRLAEYGTCYRFEDSGSLFGLMRVRSLCMNDAHIYCTEEQFSEEFGKVIELYLYYFELFGIEKYQMRLSKHSKEGLGKKYVDNEDLWVKTEGMVRDVLDRLKVPYVEVEDEAAFYGPKIDVQIWSAIGREFTLATNQLDFAVPERFDLTYTDVDGSEKTPICIHRAPLSTHERLVGFLIEHYAGAFPAWLAPVQARILPVSENFVDYAKEVAAELKKAGWRFELDDSGDTLGKKIRNAEMMKIPYMLVVGETEKNERSLAVRSYETKKQESMKLEDFVKWEVREAK